MWKTENKSTESSRFAQFGSLASLVEASVVGASVVVMSAVVLVAGVVGVSVVDNS